jgi:hypothetical protein
MYTARSEKAVVSPENSIHLRDLAVGPEIRKERGMFYSNLFGPGVLGRYGINADAQGDGVESIQLLFRSLQVLHLVSAYAGESQRVEGENDFPAAEAFEGNNVPMLILQRKGSSLFTNGDGHPGRLLFFSILIFFFNQERRILF